MMIIMMMMMMMNHLILSRNNRPVNAQTCCPMIRLASTDINFTSAPSFSEPKSINAVVPDEEES